jgi:hypothetical protein
MSIWYPAGTKRSSTQNILLSFGLFQVDYDIQGK